MSETRKTVCLMVIATFEGNYIPASQAEDYLTGWIDSGLEDRDDLRGWRIVPGVVVETPFPDEESSDA